jgi:hypothetical protein
MNEQELVLTPDTIKKILPEKLKEIQTSYPTLDQNKTNPDISHILQNIPK